MLQGSYRHIHNSQWPGGKNWLSTLSIALPSKEHDFEYCIRFSAYLLHAQYSSHSQGMVPGVYEPYHAPVFLLILWLTAYGCCVSYSFVATLHGSLHQTASSLLWISDHGWATSGT